MNKSIAVLDFPLSNFSPGLDLKKNDALLDS